MKKIKNSLQKFIAQDQSLAKLAFSFSVGTYIAFSPYPFPFGHTALTFLLTWVLGLNLGVVFFASLLINNPWTAIPVYSADYCFGYFLVRKCLNLSLVNPGWMESINSFLQQKLGFGSFCLWSFLIGGNLLGIIFAVILYPVMKQVFNRLSSTISHATVTEQ